MRNDRTQHQRDHFLRGCSSQLRGACEQAGIRAVIHLLVLDLTEDLQLARLQRGDQLVIPGTPERPAVLDRRPSERVDVERQYHSHAKPFRARDSQHHQVGPGRSRPDQQPWTQFREGRRRPPFDISQVTLAEARRVGITVVDLDATEGSNHRQATIIGKK